MVSAIIQLRNRFVKKNLKFFLTFGNSTREATFTRKPALDVERLPKLSLLNFYFNINPCGKVKALQRINRFRRWLKNV